MIPKIIHRIWINPPGPPMPLEFIEYGREWRRLHPAWEVIDWTSIEDLKPLINRRLYDEAPAKDLHRHRADILRLEILYQLGGVYVDTDMEPLRPIDDLLQDHSCILAESANRGPNDTPVVSNSFMAAQPAHDFIREAIKKLPASAAKYRNHHTAISVGPWHLQRTLDQGQWSYPRDIRILKPEIFYPQSIAARNRGEEVDLSQSYGWHKWANSRKKS